VLELWFFTLVFLLCDFYLRNTFVVFIVWHHNNSKL